MARPARTSPSTQRSTRSSGKKQVAKEFEVVVLEVADAPTQRVISRRQNTKTASQSPKTPNRSAKKRGPRSVPQEEFEEEVEAEDEENEPEPPVKRGRGAPRKSARKKDEEKQKREFQKDLDRLIAIAKSSRWAGEILQTALATPDAEQDSEDETAPVKHFKKDRIGPKERKKPVPWSQEEEAFLVDLICKQGAKWSHFESVYSGTRLYGRNQTALKDKARNIMRKIIDNDQEEEWLRRFPLWAQVTVGQARRGVHAYQNGDIPVRQVKRSYAEMVE